jgi:hypothetical protein
MCLYGSYLKEGKIKLGKMRDVLKGICTHVPLFEDLQPLWEDEEGRRWDEDGPQPHYEDGRRVSVDDLKDSANVIAYFPNSGSGYFFFEATIPRLSKNCGSLRQRRGYMV